MKDRTTFANELTNYVRAEHGVDIGGYCRAWLRAVAKRTPKAPPRKRAPKPEPKAKAAGRDE